MKIGVKIAFAFFSIASISMLVIGFISYNNAKDSLQKQSFEKLTAVRETKADQIQDYFQDIQDQLQTYAETPMVTEAMREFKAGFNSIQQELKIDDAKLEEQRKKTDNYIETEFLSRLNKNIDEKVTLNDEASHSAPAIILQNLYIINNPNSVGEKQKMLVSTDGSSYSRTHEKFHDVFRNFIEKFGYYDLFLIDNLTGNVVYTVYKEVDFASSLENGHYKTTNLADAFNAVKNAKDKNTLKIVDYLPYHPSYNAHASFIACPIFDGNVQVGVLAFQMPIDRINDIMTSKQRWSSVGLGTTGETYIIGEDYTLRNQSRFLIEDSVNYFKMLRDLKVSEKTISKIKSFNSTIGLQEVKTEGTKAALNDTSDTRIFNDYRGVSVLSAFKPLKIANMHWVILSEIDEAEAFAEVDTLRNRIIIAFLCLLILVFATSYFMSRQITRPLKELTVEAQELGNGNLNVEIVTGRKDEIGVLADSFKKMQGSITKLIMDLRDINHSLEEKVEERTAEVVNQKNIIEEKQKEIVDSILYAKRIQTAILAHDLYLEKHLPEHFVLFKPKDHISGDFYWATKKDNRFYLAVCDSTGHGVPGAFMSLLNIAFLNEAITEKGIVKPNEILNHVRARLIRNISKEGNKDGMDGILLCIDKNTNTYSYAAAHNCPVVLHNGELIEYTADKMPIGAGIREDSFEHHDLPLVSGDILYMYTDGYADQFGGPKGKKFKYKQLNDLLINHSNASMSSQKTMLNAAFEEWRGKLEQIDDVCVFGIRIP
ncbi:MAG: adenylate/guanylate cyclase protein [Bacteroidetes bacterium]|jgi:serine phosphatase RsbU (regulator of sigma subunit)|nr:adenylate/guanylate cyclase protein [Bacteroidota bacterium]